MMIESESITQSKIDWEWLYGLCPLYFKLKKEVLGT